jgi:hypothetical protein
MAGQQLVQFFTGSTSADRLPTIHARAGKGLRLRPFAPTSLPVRTRQQISDERQHLCLRRPQRIPIGMSHHERRLRGKLRGEDPQPVGGDPVPGPVLVVPLEGRF